MAKEVGDHSGGTGSNAGDLPGDRRKVGDRSKKNSFSSPPGA